MNPKEKTERIWKLISPGGRFEREERSYGWRLHEEDAWAHGNVSILLLAPVVIVGMGGTAESERFDPAVRDSLLKDPSLCVLPLWGFNEPRSFEELGLEELDEKKTQDGTKQLTAPPNSKAALEYLEELLEELSAG